MSATQIATQIATLHTNAGDIRLLLYGNHAPKTVRNFVELAEGGREWTHPGTGAKTNDPLYDGTVFHRVIGGFMIQGGDPLGRGTGGPGYRFDDEFHPELAFDRPYLLAMANSGPGHQRLAVLHHGRRRRASSTASTRSSARWPTRRAVPWSTPSRRRRPVPAIARSRTSSSSRSPSSPRTVPERPGNDVPGRALAPGCAGSAGRAVALLPAPQPRGARPVYPVRPAHLP